MYPYEKFMTTSFSIFEAHYSNIMLTLGKVERARRLSLRFLTMTCTAKYGYPAQAHVPDDASKMVDQIPTSYDSAVMLPLLREEGIGDEVLNALKSVLLSSRRENGNWNFFIPEEDAEIDLFPDDIDDTSCPLVALYWNGDLTLEELRSQAEVVIRSAMRRTIVHQRYLHVPKVCVGCLVNFLWLLSVSGLETDPVALPSFQFIKDFLGALQRHQVGDTALPEMSYYVNRFVIYFFLSRLLDQSQYAREVLAEQFENIIVSELENMTRDKGTVSNALNISALVLAILTFKPHLSSSLGGSAQVPRLCMALVNALLDLQNPDGSFPTGIVYKWNKLGYYGGSRAYTTALALHAIGKLEREVMVKEWEIDSPRL
ncbi:hypothetical protein JDV02_008044 [Purpureocillium takamizusanense]|uniref:Uncharacterized protein n=1 Tax=Purpureocillium takamizusanense TaxID=2060973 RepID=A0A9Q8QNW9_9HYPO|nr:uncharacterized protein JDV02_008044 [Purpureocillium takamizusanense]UNI22124.1 hypothetical protein JDV02_008044 [Purpureocillium takamizusanense]